MPVTKTSWQKGRSGNRRGRPGAGEELSALLRQMVDWRRFAEKLCELCYAGDVQAMRLLLSYTDGLPLVRAEVERIEGIQITVNYVQQNNRLELTSATPGAGEKAWQQSIRPTLTDLQGVAWFLSTPKGMNYFKALFDLGQDPEREDWASWQTCRPSCYSSAQDRAGGRSRLCHRL